MTFSEHGVQVHPQVQRLGNKGIKVTLVELGRKLFINVTEISQAEMEELSAQGSTTQRLTSGIDDTNSCDSTLQRIFWKQ